MGTGLILPSCDTEAASATVAPRAHALVILEGADGPHEGPSRARTMARVEVVTSVQPRRRWSREEKERLVAATLEPDAVVSELARREGVHSSQRFRWRRQLCRPLAALLDFAEVAMAPDPLTALVTAG